MSHIDTGVAKSNYDVYVIDRLKTLSCILNDIELRIESDIVHVASEVCCKVSYRPSD